MPTDLVVDTNVLVHAQNPSEQRCNDARTLLHRLLNDDTALCVDEGFNPDEALNRSSIGAEYVEHIRAGTLPYTVIAQLAMSGRVVQKPKRAPRREQKLIEQMIRNRTDRVFLGVAFNSISKVLVSHDFTDFQIQKRPSIRRALGVDVLEAAEILEQWL